MFHWDTNLFGANFEPSVITVWWLIPVFIWSSIWKGLALWVTARRNQSSWFIFLLIFNTLGIVEILYLVVTGGLKELRKGA